MRILDAVERSPLSIPITDVMNAAGQFDFVPEVKEKGYFDIDYRKSELIVVAGKFIGQIPLTPDLTIHVSPKVPLNNLARIIGVANQPVRCLDFFRRRYKLDGAASSSVQEAIARSLVASLKELALEGVFREYREFRQELSTVRGRMDIAAIVSRTIPKGQFTNMPCIYFAMTADTLYNRAIKRTIFELGSILSREPDVKKELLQELESFYDLFESVHLDRSPALVYSLQDAIERFHIPDLRSYYRDILDVCFIVLAGSGLEVIDRDGPKGMHSLVIDLENTFEQYVRGILQQKQEFKDKSVSILDGNKEGKGRLFSTTEKYEAKPDIVLQLADGTTALGDVKYKTKLDEKDRYQLIAHSLAYNSSRAFFVTPALESNSAGPEKIGKIGNIEMFHYRLNLDSPNLIDVETTFTDWVHANMC